MLSPNLVIQILDKNLPSFNFIYVGHFNFDRITDAGVKYIVESSCGPKLQEFNLTNCIRVGDMAMVNIHKKSVSCYREYCLDH